MANERKPTEKMLGALRKFNVPENEISGLSFEDASKRLDELISKARGRKKNPEPAAAPAPEQPKQENEQPSNTVVARIRERVRLAKQIVKTEFGLNDDLLNPDGILLGEVLKQIGSEQMIAEIQQNKESNLERFRGIR